MNDIKILNAMYCHVKLKFTLEQATKIHKGNRGIDLLFL